MRHAGSAAGGFFTICHLTQQSLWTDEGFTCNVIARADMLPEIAADTHPPLYYLLLRGWVLAAGNSVLPSLLSVALMVPLAKTLTRRWTANSMPFLARSPFPEPHKPSSSGAVRRQ